jgi:hypothetical protein
MSINTAENGEEWEELCEDHWHCDPRHACAKVDRTRPCPTCKQEPVDKQNFPVDS